MENTKIEWATHTFNPWTGCTKVSPACDHCYAEAWAKRAGRPELWHGERSRTKTWNEPVRWNRLALAARERHRVFCASLADVWDNQVDPAWRRDLFHLIWNTPHLDWLLLTKRPQNIEKMLWPAIGEAELWPWANVWLGCTAENQEEADRRIPVLLSIPAVVHFISAEPLLGAVDLSSWPDRVYLRTVGSDGAAVRKGVDWVICGGESGGGKRPMDLAWARSLRDQCVGSGVAFFMKQIDKVKPIPDDLMIRQLPVAGRG